MRLNSSQKCGLLNDNISARDFGTYQDALFCYWEIEQPQFINLIGQQV